MIKTIQYHLAEDKDFQERLEAEQAEKLNVIWQTNKAVFCQFMPNLMPVFSENAVDEYGLFCNKEGHFNLAGKSNGQVIYDLNPRAECAAEVQDFLNQAPVFHLSGNHVRPTPSLRAFHMPESKGYVPALPVKPLPQQPHTVIVLGLGLGYVLDELLKVTTPQNIVVYEPTLDFFRGSVQVANWQSIMLSAQERGVRLFLQVGQDGSGIASDLKELQSAFQTDEVFILRHYHHPVMDAIYDYLLSAEFSLERLLNDNIQIRPTVHITQYLPPRAGRVQSQVPREQAAAVVAEAEALKEKNLAVFAQEFPEIYAQFANYEPQQWRAFVGDDLELNLYHEMRLGALYHEQPSVLAQQSVKSFSEEPNRNDMFAGYKGGKLWRYTHFQHARKFGALFDELESDGQFIPDVLSSVIWFGLGLGLQLEPLVESYDIKSLYIYEPNPDFFYWSLFTVPWHEILPRQREAGMHWYINIGDDGTYLAEDMFTQFHSDGGYLTASAYFYLPMYYPAMQGNIKQLKRDFQSYLMLCEYYDHVRYYLAHTQENLRNGAVMMKASGELSQRLKQTPVLLVGNGPSLDESIAQLKARKGEFLIVSCGTALKALYEAGITPDFHTDVEQNRATYQWITQVPDRDWLKQITALTLTSFHPESAALFKEQWVVFKKGESGTACYLRSNAVTHEFDTLDYCYPTVSNMALSMAVQMGFENIILMGIDLGYKDPNHHHSKHSAYYKAPTEKSWSKPSVDALAVAGNFGDTVFTKYEFHLSRRVMSQLLRLKPEVKVVNTSDGAFIEGTIPSHFSAIAPHPHLDRNAVRNELKTSLFSAEQAPAMVKRIDALNDPEIIKQCADRQLALLDIKVTSRNEAMERLSKEKELFTTFFFEDSLWFYLMYTSSHFVSSALVRLLYMANDEAQSLENFQRGTEIWRRYIEAARDQWLENGHVFDQTIVKALLPKDPAPPSAS